MADDGKDILDRLVLDPKAVWSVMRYGDAQPDSEVCAMVDEIVDHARSIARPRYVSTTVPAALTGPHTVVIGGVDFRVGTIIASYLEGMTEACVFVASAGREFNDYLKSVKEDILTAYVADSVGTVIAEACVDFLDKELSAREPRPHSLPYSPGYCAWDIREQRKLFSLLPPEPCGVELTDSCLMYPEKSVSGFFGIGEHLVHQPYRCGVCPNRSCYKNRNR